MNAANYRGYDYPIETLFWGTLIFLALFVSCFLAWKATEWLRNRRKFDGVAAEGEHLKDPHVTEGFMSHVTDIGGFSERGEQEFLLHYGSRKECKAIKERRKARKQAQKHQSDS